MVPSDRVSVHLNGALQLDLEDEVAALTELGALGLDALLGYQLPYMLLEDVSGVADEQTVAWIARADTVWGHLKLELFMQFFFIVIGLTRNTVKEGLDTGQVRTSL